MQRERVNHLGDGALCGVPTEALGGAPAEARTFSSSAAGIAPDTLRPLVKNKVGVLLMWRVSPSFCRASIGSPPHVFAGGNFLSCIHSSQACARSAAHQIA